MSKLREIRLGGLVVLVLLLNACATLDEEAPQSADQIYEEGRKALADGFYDTAVKRFDALSAQYPFGTHAPAALLDLAYVHYKLNEPESAIAAANQFIKTYPRDPNIDYAYYLRGLADFDANAAFGDDWIGLDSAQRDPKRARQSFQYFAELLQRFPESRFAPDAAQRMVYLRNYLARHEIYVARYYMRLGAYLAAIKRSTYVLEHFPRTPSVHDALGIMSAGYRRLGIDDLAADADRVLDANLAP